MILRERPMFRNSDVGIPQLLGKYEYWGNASVVAWQNSTCQYVRTVNVVSSKYLMKWPQHGPGKTEFQVEVYILLYQSYVI